MIGNDHEKNGWFIANKNCLPLTAETNKFLCGKKIMVEKGQKEQLPTYDLLNTIIISGGSL